MNYPLVKVQAHTAPEMWTSKEVSTERSPTMTLVNILAWIIVGGIAGWLDEGFPLSE